jgi:choline dehydrogenase-like flavoprotein
MTFDYVIAGGGTAGCVLAARLSEDPKISVCLLEAGGDGRDKLLKVPVGAAVYLRGLFGLNNWAYSTTPQKALNNRRGYQPRGKTLGGSSAINAMLYLRGVPADYDGWESKGARGWAWRDVLPYFTMSENNVRGADDLHGANGPLQVSNQRAPMPINNAFVAAAEAHQFRHNNDFNGPNQEGVGQFQVMQFHEEGRKGERCSASAAYLFPAINRPNLTVITRARSSAIQFEGMRAVGIEYHKGGKLHEIRAGREVIICSGAFGSPQLLQLSGIGDAKALASHGIAVHHHLPGVGKNLQDHPDFILLNKSADSSLFGFGPGGVANTLKAIANWRAGRPSILSSTFAESGAFIKSDKALDVPDLQLHFVVALVDDHTRKLHWGYGYSCHVCVLRPFSRGEVTLASADPKATPLINPNFLSDERDLDLLVKGTRIVREMMNDKAFAPYRSKELYLRGDENDEELRDHIRSRADTIYHPVGTCRMGTDKMAVVDPQLRVHGMEGLRVVDASVMPTLIGGNTTAPVIMIAEKAADMIRNTNW